MDNTSRHSESIERQGDSSNQVLRAKYLDYCSARISEVFLSLTDERIYELMEEAAREAELIVGSLSFQEMMRLVTHKLHESIPLPDLDTWIEEYRAEPEKYDPFLLGLWRSAEQNPPDEDPNVDPA